MDLILFCRVQRNLDQHNLADVFGMRFEEGFKRKELVANALDFVKFIAANEQAHVSVAFAEYVDPMLHLWFASSD